MVMYRTCGAAWPWLASRYSGIAASLTTLSDCFPARPWREGCGEEIAAASTISRSSQMARPGLFRGSFICAPPFTGRKYGRVSRSIELPCPHRLLQLRHVLHMLVPAPRTKCPQPSFPTLRAGLQLNIFKWTTALHAKSGTGKVNRLWVIWTPFPKYAHFLLLRIGGRIIALTLLRRRAIQRLE